MSDRPPQPGTPTSLVVGTDDWAIEQGARTLEAAGHTVARCHDPGAPVFPCLAFIEGRQCPLDRGVDVVVTMRARADEAPMTAEVGVVCGRRLGIPLVVAGIGTGHPFGRWATSVVEHAGDLPDACARAIRHTVDLTGEQAPSETEARGSR